MRSPFPHPLPSIHSLFFTFPNFELHVLLTFSLCRLHRIHIVNESSAPNPHTSRYSAPNNPSNSGDILALLTGGKLSMPQRGGFGSGAGGFGGRGMGRG